MIVRQRLGEGSGENGLSVEAVRPTVPSSPSRHSADLQEILQMILEQSDHLVDCDACALLLLTGDTLHVVASRGFPGPERVEQLRFNLKAQPDLRRVIEAGHPVVFPDVTIAEPSESIAALGGFRACIRAPLIYRDRPIGLLVLLKAEPDAYSEKDAQFTMAFAGQAAMAIENARLYAEARRQALQLEAASQAGQKVTSILELDELLAEVVRLIRETFGYYHVHLFLVDGQSNEIVLRASSGHANESLKTRGLRLKIGEQGITGWVAQHREPVAVNMNAAEDPRFKLFNDLPEDYFEAFLSVPVVSRGRVVGVINLQNRTPYEYTRREVGLIVTIGVLVGAEIEMARLENANVHLSDQLESRQIIQRAKGILQRSLGINDVGADLILEQESRRRGKSVREISESLLLSEEPKPGK